MTADVVHPIGLNTLQASLARNRFLPRPTRELMQCGDGDFRAVGAEFLGHLIRHARLGHNERVLDLGCGVGRLAIPLTQYLDDDARYFGVDVAADGIAWCQTAISQAYPHFEFQHLDLHHPLYNPTGALNTAEIRLPFDDASFDVICLVSVFTHLDTPSLTNYAREISRLLAPGGRCLATAFLINPPAREAQRRCDAPLQFDLSGDGPEFFAHPEAPLAAVAFDEDHFLEKFLRFGRERRQVPQYGHWSGRPSSVFQDINVLE